MALYYFVKDTSSSAKGFINIDKEIPSSSSKTFKIYDTLKRREFHISASTPAEAKEWIQAINELVKTKNSKI